MNKEIRKNLYNEKKETIQMKIRPANAKSLWESVKIARDEDNDPIPNEMYLGGVKYSPKRSKIDD